MSDTTDIRRLNIFERYLTLWVALCMAVGIGLSKLLPGVIDALSRLECGGDNPLNPVPIRIVTTSKTERIA
jgi:ACR3 family arsenite transporter